jgi:hypothetical protein
MISLVCGVEACDHSRSVGRPRGSSHGLDWWSPDPKAEFLTRVASQPQERLSASLDMNKPAAASAAMAKPRLSWWLGFYTEGNAQMQLT